METFVFNKIMSQSRKTKMEFEREIEDYYNSTKNEFDVTYEKEFKYLK